MWVVLGDCVHGAPSLPRAFRAPPAPRQASVSAWSASVGEAQNGLRGASLFLV